MKPGDRRISGAARPKQMQLQAAEARGSARAPDSDVAAEEAINCVGTGITGPAADLRSVGQQDHLLGTAGVEWFVRVLAKHCQTT
jgi:hypothetical protein